MTHIEQPKEGERCDGYGMVIGGTNRCPGCVNCQPCRSELKRVVGELRRAVEEAVAQDFDFYVGPTKTMRKVLFAAFDKRCGELGIKLE